MNWALSCWAIKIVLSSSAIVHSQTMDTLDVTVALIQILEHSVTETPTQPLGYLNFLKCLHPIAVWPSTKKEISCFRYLKEDLLADAQQNWPISGDEY